jgi:type I restriction enzyme M protein
MTKAMGAVANANDGLRGFFTVDWNQPAPDGSGKSLIPNEVVHANIQHFDEHDLSNKSVPADVLGRAYEYLMKQFADDAGAKAGEFFTPPEVVDTRYSVPSDFWLWRHAGSYGGLSARAWPARH